MHRALRPSDSEERFRVSAKAQEIVEALHDVLDGAVALRDTNKVHLSMGRGRWLSGRIDRKEPYRGGGGCVVEMRINDRWFLIVSSRQGLHADAESIVKWAADKLALHLPRRAADDETFPPFGGGGGSGGSAEIGIPVWWARKTRN